MVFLRAASCRLATSTDSLPSVRLRCDAVEFAASELIRVSAFRPFNSVCFHGMEEVVGSNPTRSTNTYVSAALANESDEPGGARTQNRRIAARRERNGDRILAALRLIILTQFSPQPLRLHPDDGIRTGIVVLAAVEYVAAQGIFLQLIQPSKQCAFHGQRQKTLHLSGPSKDIAFDDPLQLPAHFRIRNGH